MFWMFVAAFFGMATKYSECLLAVKYREVDEKGRYRGGPMYYIKMDFTVRVWQLCLLCSQLVLAALALELTVR